MRVLIVSQYYPPENVPLPASLARGLAERGHAVRVLTAFPNYPSGRIFDGFTQRWRQREMQDGVAVCRVPLFPSHSSSALARMVNYLSFGLSSLTARRYARGADVVYVYATQMTAAMGPWLWRMTGGAPYVLHVQDLWPDSITGSSLVSQGLGAYATRAILTPWLDSVYRGANSIVAIAPTMRQTLIERGVEPRKLFSVFNWADGAPSASTSTPDHLLDAPIRLVYAGNVGDMQDLGTLVHAVARLPKDAVRLKIIGDGVALPKVRALAESLDADNVEFAGRVSPESMASVYADADFALVTLKNLPSFHGTIPSKLQAALAHGVPVVTTVPGDVRGIVGAADVGFVAEPEDVDSLEAALRAAVGLSTDDRARMGQRAEELYAERFSSVAGVMQLEDILASAIRRTEGRP